MSTQRDRRKPWFWQQRSPLFWEGWAHGGLAVTTVVVIGTVLLFVGRARELIIVITLAVPVTVIPYYLGMKSWLRDQRVQAARAQAMRTEIKRMVAEAEALKVSNDKMAAALLERAGGSDE